MCNTLGLDEVYAPRAYAKARVETPGGANCEICYDRVGHCLSYSEVKVRNEPKFRLEPLILPLPDSKERVKRFVYLSHVLTQCGLSSKSVRPLWRLLRHGYTMRLTNFKRLVGVIARGCDRRSDFTRNICAPANGLRIFPRFEREARPLVVKGIQVPRWTWKEAPYGASKFQCLKLD